MKSGKNVTCEVCGKIFYINPSRFKNKHHTCSTECMGKLNSELYSKKIKTNCVCCGKEIFYKKHKFSQIKHHTCSRSCRNEMIKTLYKGDENPRALKLNKIEKFFYDRIYTIKRRSDIKGWEFNLTYKDLLEIYEKQGKCCYYTKLPLRLFGPKNYDTLSVDRIDSNKGYSKDNIVLALLCVNMFKSNYDLKDMKEVFKSLEMGYNNPINVKIKKLFENSQLPIKKNKDDAGYDIFVHHVEDCGNFIKVFSGISVQPETGFYFELVPRSSTYKLGLIMYNSFGVIDNNYTGELICVFNKTLDFKELPKYGDRLAQLILKKQYHIEFNEVDDLSETDRGSGGFGSTNK